MIVTSAAVSTTPITGTPHLHFPWLAASVLHSDLLHIAILFRVRQQILHGIIQYCRLAPALLTILAFALGVEFSELSFFGLGQL